MASAHWAPETMQALRALAAKAENAREGAAADVENALLTALDEIAEDVTKSDIRPWRSLEEEGEHIVYYTSVGKYWLLFADAPPGYVTAIGVLGNSKVPTVQDIGKLPDKLTKK